MSKPEVHIGKMETQLKQWGAKLDEFVTKAEGVGAVVKEDYCKQIEFLKAKHKVVQTKLDEFKVASGKEWETFKTGVEDTWNDLEVAFKKLTK